jgi:hypothetical protein
MGDEVAVLGAAHFNSRLSVTAPTIRFEQDMVRIYVRLLRALLSRYEASYASF